MVANGRFFTFENGNRKGLLTKTKNLGCNLDE